VGSVHEHKKYGRGSYNSHKQEIALEILPPAELFLVLVHELFHYYDEKLLFGQYWFLSSSYLKNYKEFLPRFMKCQIFIELEEIHELEDIPAGEHLYYSQVINHKKDCFKLESEYMQRTYRSPHFFWSEHKWQYALVQGYRIYWRDINHLKSPLY